MKKPEPVLQICKHGTGLFVLTPKKYPYQHSKYLGNSLAKGKSQDTKTNIQETTLQKNSKIFDTKPY
ncbi:hypothetical protein [Desulfonatronospira thiodismutans]|uniref:hypothetical protein n=1 Tax=Desulfonatronospira thiodismutans TaxID=488939 RepID=UPI001375F081|nr:hypothetical protein [Desulfonatronospira thiodismutans]